MVGQVFLLSQEVAMSAPAGQLAEIHIFGSEMDHRPTDDGEPWFAAYVAINIWSETPRFSAALRLASCPARGAARNIAAPG
jgi:hypothetical protein